MMNIFSQSIGIWYKSPQWRDSMYEQVISTIPQEAILRIISNRNEKRICLIDNSCISFIPVKESMKGKRFNRAYIQKDVTFEEYTQIVNPSIYPRFFDAIVVDTLDDFVYGQKADKYYWLEYE